jgi:protein O-GlcNAc transferase
MNASSISESPTQNLLAQSLQQAVIHHQAGRLAEARVVYIDLLRLHPTEPDVNHNLGVLEVQSGRHAVALPYFKAALATNPERPHHWLSYIETLIQVGEASSARQLLVLASQHGLQAAQVERLNALIVRAATVTTAPMAQQAASALSTPTKRAATAKTSRAIPVQKVDALMALLDQANYEAALACAQSMTSTYAQQGFGWKVLAHVLVLLGRSEEALTSIERARLLSPEDVEVCNLQGNIYASLQLWEPAQLSYLDALRIKPDFADVYSNLGMVQRELGQYQAAAESCRQALHLKPDFANALTNLANALRDMKQLDEAEQCYRQALALNDQLADAHHGLGAVLRDAGQLDNAADSVRRALALRPSYVQAHNSLGVILIQDGHLDGAISHFRAALELKPNFVDSHCSLIFAQDLSLDLTAKDLLDERKRWDARHTQPLATHHRPHTNVAMPERRLKIGYVSGDFKRHSAASVFGMMLVHFDRANYDVIAYSNVKNEDATTQLFREQVSAWRTIIGLSDEQVSDLIRQDGIDILVDLSGHSEGNRLFVFARKPAPIQITAWGYATSTGMRAMDIFFADPVVVPPAEKDDYVEEVRYLPNLVGFFGLSQFPDVNPLPALSQPVITFGCFNRVVKSSQQTLDLWFALLLTIPNSRLILKTAELEEVSVRQRLINHFEKAGIDVQKRIVFLGKTSWFDHIAACNQIDIALDPFPHTGGVTTLEMLMMGIPTVTLRWPTITGRLSATILTTLGLTDWIAETPQQYIDIAQHMTRDQAALDKLNHLRQRLRTMLGDSIIGNSVAYTRAVEAEYRYLWQRWCSAQQVDSATTTTSTEISTVTDDTPGPKRITS